MKRLLLWFGFRFRFLVGLEPLRRCVGSRLRAQLASASFRSLTYPPASQLRPADVYKAAAAHHRRKLADVRI